MAGALSHSPWDVLEEHLDEAEHLAGLRPSLLESATLSLGDVADGSEARLLAHVDGLDLGGDAVLERLLKPALTDASASRGRVVAVALTLLTSRDRARGRRLLESVPALDENAQLAVFSALGACDRDDLGKLVTRLVIGASRETRPAVLDAAWSRGDDIMGALDSLLPTTDRAVEALVARAAAWADPALLPWLEGLVASGSSELREAAWPAALMMRSTRAWASVVEHALGQSRANQAAMTWVAQLGDASEARALIDRLASRDARPEVVWSLGFSGRRAAADACVEHLADEMLGPLAAEAFAGITGLDRRDARYWQPASGGLRPPRPAAVKAWWSEQRSRFSEDGRYILGRPSGLESLYNALAIEPMRRRHAHALELLVRSEGRARVHTRMLTAAQYRSMDALRTLPQIPFTPPFRTPRR